MLISYLAYRKKIYLFNFEYVYKYLRMDRKRAEIIASELKALADPTRVLILFELMGKEESSPREMAREIGVSENVISQQLANLRRDGIVTWRRDGVKKPYAIRSGAIAPTILRVLEKFCTQG